MKLKTVIILLTVILLVLVLLIFAKCNTAPKTTTKTVSCNEGESLSNAVASSKSGTRIIVKGTCKESHSVMVTQDNIIIDGKGTAVIDGQGENRPVLTIKGAKDVIVNGVTVKNGKQGIVTGFGAKTILKDVIVTENARNGVVISKTGKLPGMGKENSEIEQQKPVAGKPLSFNNFNVNLSPVGEAVASTYPCSCADTLLNGGGDSDQCTAALEDNTMVVCGSVSSVGNGGVGMYVLTSDLVTEGRLLLADNGYYAGFYVGRESTITVTESGAIVAERNTGSGVHVYESTMYVSGSLETRDNSGQELFIEDEDTVVVCKTATGDIQLQSSDENRDHCKQETPL